MKKYFSKYSCISDNKQHMIEKLFVLAFCVDRIPYFKFKTIHKIKETFPE